MSSSSLTSLPPSSLRNPLSSEAEEWGNNASTSARPIVRRTFGRARRDSPVEEDIPRQIFFEPQVQARHSPSKALLNRFSESSSAWRDSLAGLGATGEKEDDEIDPDEMEKAMAQMRKAARGVDLPPPSDFRPTSLDHNAVPARDSTALHLSKPPLLSKSSTSTLTAPPTSSPPPTARIFSPNTLLSQAAREPDKSEAESDESSPPVRRLSSKASGKQRRIIASDDEEEPARRSHEGTDKSASPTPRASRTRRRVSSEQTSHSQSGDDDDESTPDLVQMLIDRIADREPEDEAAEINQKPTSEDPVDLFDDDEDSIKPRGSKAPKPLNKKDLKTMQSDMARMRREREAASFKVESERLPISSWFQMAQHVVNPPTKSYPGDPKMPALTFGSSPPTSPSQVTPPEDISAFTPSSANARKSLQGSSLVNGVTHRTSSPTPQITLGATTRMLDSHEDDDEDMPTITEILAKGYEKRLEEENRRKNLDKLQALKLAALREQAGRPLLAREDDDFTIFEDELRKPTIEEHRGPDAKAVLHRDSALPALSRNRQQQLRYAGKSGKVKAEVTETFAEYAGRKYDHAGQRVALGGAKPAGQKQGREIPISAQQVEAMMKLGHQKQATEQRRAKEENWGRVRILPKKEQQDMSDLITAVPEDFAAESDDADEDDDDEDFAMSEDGSQSAEEGLVYSGEEDEGEGEEGEGVAESLTLDDSDESPIRLSAEPSDADKENLPEGNDEEGEDTNLVKPPTHRRSRKVIFGSDDESEIPRAPTVNRAPLQEMPVPQVTQKSSGSLFGNVGGFDADASQGFSQLFEATQPADQPTRRDDGFAGLRSGGPVGLLPAHALLPKVNITETQARRDAALIAAEAEVEAEEAMLFVETEPKQQYLNEQGLFTQTKPVRRASTPSSDVDDADGGGPLAGKSGYSFLSNMGSSRDSQEAPNGESSTTDVGTSRVTVPSPSQPDGPLRRLKRRTSNDLSAQVEAQAPPSTATAKNAFDMLMTSRSAPPKAEERRRLRETNLFDEQAEESDEDNGWAPLGGPEDEDDDKDDEGFLPDLVDDVAIDEDEQARNRELAAEKQREIEAADDARREAQAKKVVEGEYRIKRKGVDFFSDDEDDHQGRKISSKDRKAFKRARKAELEAKHGEENAFVKSMIDDMESDNESVEEDPAPQSLSPPTARRSAREQRDMLKEIAERNRGKDLTRLDDQMDEELGFDDSDGLFSRLPLVDPELSDTETTTFTSFAVSRIKRRKLTKIGSETRSVESLQKFISEESSTTRRTGGPMGVSVVVTGGSNGRPHIHRNTSSGGKSVPRPSGGSVLLSKGNRFG